MIDILQKGFFIPHHALVITEKSCFVSPALSNLNRTEVCLQKVQSSYCAYSDIEIGAGKAIVLLAEHLARS